MNKLSTVIYNNSIRSLEYRKFKTYVRSRGIDAGDSKYDLYCNILKNIK